MALWILSGTTRVSRYQKKHLWDSKVNISGQLIRMNGDGLDGSSLQVDSHNKSLA